MLLGASLVSQVVPQVEAQATPWTTESLAAITGSVSITDLNVAVAEGTEKVGLSYIASGNIQFLVCQSQCQSSDNWVKKNSDVTGATTPNLSELTWAGGLDWSILVFTGSTFINYHSADDGATWTPVTQNWAGACNCLLFDLKSNGAGTIYYLTGVQTTNTVRFGASTDYGSTELFASVISDNEGGLTAPTQSIGAYTAKLLVDGGFYVEFQEAGLQDVYAVESEDGVFWSVPYTTAGGSTKAPVNPTTDCPITAVPITQGGIALAGTPSQHLDWFPSKDGANNQYLCSYNGSTDGLAYPNAAPATRNDNWAAHTTGQGAGGRAIATNGFGQFIAAGREGVDNYVVYKVSNNVATQWSEVFTTPADTQHFSVAATSNQAFFFYTDNGACCGGRLTVASAPMEPPGNQVAVNQLVGYSMDAKGQNIVVRTDAGLTVETYGVGNLGEGAIGTASTPDCNVDGVQVDGVNVVLLDTETLEDQPFVTYVDCAGDGDSDAFRIRTLDLTSAPEFPCDEATENVEHNGASIIIPENLGEIGTISDLNPSYVGRCGEGGLNDASVGWSFSTVGTQAEGGGRIGAAAYTYNSVLVDQSTDGDADTIIIDSTATPTVEQFCSWTNLATGRDYIAGASLAGSTKVAEVVSSVVHGITGAGTPELDFNTVFSSGPSGTYGGAYGLSCANDSVAILKGDQAFLLEGITSGSPTVASGWPITVVEAESRGIVLSGSGRFVAITTGGAIELYSSNGTNTGTYPLPEGGEPGTFKGMEWDTAGETLAVFTSSFITVFPTGADTCALEDDCAAWSNTNDNPPICPTPPCTSSVGGGDDDAIPGHLDFGSPSVNLLVGVLLIISLVFMGIEKGAGNVGLALILITGLALAYAIGWIPLGFLLMLTVLTIGALWFMPGFGRGSNQDGGI